MLQLGPNLYDIMGRPIASYEDYEYSEEIKKYKGIWTEAAMIAFLKNAGETNMPSFPDLTKEQKIQIIRYMECVAKNF